MSKENAKIEFLNHISNRGVICASIRRGYDWDSDIRSTALTFNLTTGWTKEDWNNFLKEVGGFFGRNSS